MFDQIAHALHVGPGVAVRDQACFRCFAQNDARDARAVALRKERRAHRMIVERLRIHVPEIEAQRGAITIACQTVRDRGEQIVDARIDQRHLYARSGVSRRYRWVERHRLRLVLQLLIELVQIEGLSVAVFNRSCPGYGAIRRSEHDKQRA